MEKTIKDRRIKEANKIIFDRESRFYSKRRRIKFDRKTSLKLMRDYENVMEDKFQPIDRFLDIGCGDGLILLNLKPLGFISKAYGVDLSFGMLKECKSNANKLNINVLLVQSDVEQLPFKDNSFDLIVGHAILHHLPTAREAFKEVYRLLKLRGRCIFIEPSKIGSKIIATLRWFIWSLPFLIRQITKSPMERLIEVNTFTPQELEKEARISGFKIVYTKPFAGFISRIFYWILDPISQRTSNRYYHLIVDKIINILSILDERLFRKFIPKGWFDEIFIFMQKI